jgi:CCR4-NOT transcription complex subunit 10
MLHHGWKRGKSGIAAAMIYTNCQTTAPPIYYLDFSLQSNELDFDIQKKQKEIVVDVIGSKDKQKVILTTNLTRDKKYSTDSQSYAVPVPSLEFASLSLRNALLLLPSDTTASPVPLFLIPGVTPPVPSSSPGPAPSSPLSPESVISLRNSILAASAYVSLCLGDYILALEHAENLLQQPRLSGAHKYYTDTVTISFLVMFLLSDCSVICTAPRL